MKIYDPQEETQWDERIAQLDRPSLFYSSLWAAVLHDSYQYRPIYFVQRQSEAIHFLLPVMEISSRITGRRGVSLPFTDFCDPYVIDPIDFEPAISEAIELGKQRGWRSLEIRGGKTLLKNQKPSLHYFRHQLKLSDETTLFNDLKNSTQRNIRKAQKYGVTIRFDDSALAMENFYHLNCLTRKKHGLPPQPMAFFRNVLNYVIKKKHGIIALANFQNKVIAAAIFFIYQKSVIYKFGASDIEHLPLRANNLLMWEAIAHFTTHDYQLFDFGKTEIANEGLRKYKFSWGADEKRVPYYKYDYQSNSFIQDRNKESGWYNAVFKKMPLPLLKLTGALLYKHVG
ncbi:MAG: GNAT family N-acetyltransferase [bacterium]|nr:GNAT family N-acetyltransferase [bacterium]